jgi:hypothetical protein
MIAPTHRQVMQKWHAKFCEKKTSRFYGVSKCSCTGRWRASVSGRKGKGDHIGRFDSEIEAALAYDRVVEKEFGLKAFTNFPRQMRLDYEAEIRGYDNPIAKQESRFRSLVRRLKAVVNCVFDWLLNDDQ